MIFKITWRLLGIVLYEQLNLYSKCMSLTGHACAVFSESNSSFRNGHQAASNHLLLLAEVAEFQLFIAVVTLASGGHSVVLKSLQSKNLKFSP